MFEAIKQGLANKIEQVIDNHDYKQKVKNSRRAEFLMLQNKEKAIIEEDKVNHQIQLIKDRPELAHQRRMMMKDKVKEMGKLIPQQ